MSEIDELVDGIYRISTTFAFDGFDFQFNQFLIDDARPALIHTRETIPSYVRALREEPFAYCGKVLGRELPSGGSRAIVDPLTSRPEDSDLEMVCAKSNACTGAQSCGTSAPAYHAVDEERR